MNQLSDPADQEAEYREAISHCPRSPELAGNFAIFMTTVAKKYDEAERLYRNAIELAPNVVTYTGNYASFLWEVRKNYDEAERLYRKAVELDPKSAIHTGNFANFMAHVRKNVDEAERLYNKALELDPNRGNHTGNFAGFALSQGQLDKANHLIGKAIKRHRGQARQDLAEVLIYKATLEALRNTSNEHTLEELRSILKAAFLRSEWTFEPLFASVVNQLEPETLAILRAYGDAVLNESKAAVLEETLSTIRNEFAVAKRRVSKQTRAKRPGRKTR